MAETVECGLARVGLRENLAEGFNEPSSAGAFGRQQ